MIRKIAAVTSVVLWISAFLYNIFVEYIPTDIIQYIDSLYPGNPYEMYLSVVGLLMLWVSCFLIYKNSKFAIHSIAITLLVSYLPYLFIAGIDANNNVASNLVELSDLSYGIAIGALLIENKVFAKTRRKIKR
jgi:hypothetical protein